MTTPEDRIVWEADEEALYRAARGQISNLPASDAPQVSQPTPADTGACEALVERIAEAIAGGKERAELLARINPGELANAFRDAEAVLPLMDAEVSAAVEASRADVSRWKSAWQRGDQAWAEDRADRDRLREGIRALHFKTGIVEDGKPVDWCKADGREWPCPTIALLAPSPAATSDVVAPSAEGSE